MSTLAIEELRAKARLRARLPEPAARRAIRLAAGLSLRDIGAAVGVSAEAVRLWEAGLRRPTGERLRHYGELLAALQGELRAPLGAGEEGP